MHLLKAMTKHRPVHLVEDVLADMKRQIGLMPRIRESNAAWWISAQCKPIRDHGVAARLTVADDVGCVQ